MVMSLQGELEPLLANLVSAAESLFEFNMSQSPGGTPSQNQQAESVFHSDVSTLAARFRGYYSLDGPDLAQVADQFLVSSDQWTWPAGSSVFSCIARAAGNVDDATKLIHLGLWKGDGADIFYHNFLVPFGQAAAVHALCVRELAIAATALADAVELTKESVVWICKRLIVLLGGGGSAGTAPGEEETSGKEIAGLVSVMADAVAVFKAVTAPELDIIDVALAATGWGGGMIAESKSQLHEWPIDVTGSGPIAVASTLLYNAWTALDGLDRNIAELDEKINQGLETDLNESGPFSNPTARLQRPNLKSSAYQELEFKGLDDAKDAVVVNVVQLYYTGYRTLPAAGEQYGAAATACSAAQIVGVDHQFPRAVGKFNEAAHVLDGLLTTASNGLTNSAAAMVQAATTYRAADEYESGQIRMLEYEIATQGSYQYTLPEWLVLHKPGPSAV